MPVRIYDEGTHIRFDTLLELPKATFTFSVDPVNSYWTFSGISNTIPALRSLDYTGFEREDTTPFASTAAMEAYLNTLLANLPTSTATISGVVDTLTVLDTNNPTGDAFGRLRVSEKTNLLNAKLLFDKAPLFFDEVVNATATSVHSTTNSQVVMTVNANGDYVIRQTFQRYNYITGSSHLVIFTFSGMETTANVSKRVGYFSSSTVAPHTADFDGIYLEDDGTTKRLKIDRLGTNVHNVARADWNDKLDGTGASGLNLDFSLTQIFAIDFQWLGVGTIRFLVSVGGKPYEFHRINNANVGTLVYMSRPNQPVRYEIRSTGGIDTFQQICCAVDSEGNSNVNGFILSQNRGTNFLNANVAGTKYASQGFRLKPTHFAANVDFFNVNALGTTNDDFLVEVILNPTVAGVFTYNDITNSALQYAEGALTNTVTGGTVIWSAYVRQTSTANFAVKTSRSIGASIAGVADQAVIVVTPISAGLNIYTAAQWQELD